VVLKTLVGLKDSEEGRSLLEEIGIEGFVPASNSDYQAFSPMETGR
jgi:hypothetical protein